MASTLTSQKYVNIYTEANPNPNSLKFVLNDMIVDEGNDYDFANEEAAANSPLAKNLFGFPGVERVFLMNNFVTITKRPDLEWIEIAPPIKQYIKEYFEAGKQALSSSTEREDAIKDSDSEPVKKIKSLLDEYVRPSVEGDGGAITFKSLNEDGIVTVELRGSCSGCPSSTLTLKAGIENLLTRSVPEVKQVVAQGM